jgi:tetratricopeptide (TPR) repeat protein
VRCWTTSPTACSGAGWGFSRTAALDIDASQATDPATRAALVRNAIGQRRFLLVIDDAWAPPENALLLKCGGPNCAHFLTTRNETIARAFADPQGKVDIRELDPGDALDLLKTLAPEACAAEPDAARELVAAVGYLPLAVELMGAYLSAAENRYFREQQTAALQRMADPAERLRQACKRVGDARGAQVTLKETIRLSLEGLPDEAVDAFHALGAFAPKPETFDAKAAVAVTGASLSTLSRLIERHLLEHEGEALSIHQTIADVAREHTPADAVEHHAGHYLGRVRGAGEDWRAIESLYAQVKWAFDQSHDAFVVLAFTEGLRDYQSRRGLRADALLWSDLEIRFSKEASNLRREALALNDRGWLHSQMGERDRALEYFAQALPLQRAAGNTEGEAVTLNNIGSVYDSLGERDRALEYYEQALPLLRAAGATQLEAATLNNIGVLYENLGERARALKYFAQALPIRRAVGDKQGEAITLNNTGLVYDNLAERERALEYYEQALPLMRAIGDRQGEATTLNNIGTVYDSLGERGCALEYYEQALSLLLAVADRQGEAATLNNIGRVYDSQGKRDRALKCYEQALRLMRAVGDRAGEAVTRFNIAMIYRAMGRLKEAVEELEEVVRLEAAVRHPELERHRQTLANVKADLAQRDSGASPES